MQWTLVNSSGFRVFPFWKGKGLLLVANTLALLQTPWLSAACFCNGKACIGENDCKHICICFLRCRRRPDLCMWWNTHVHVYSFVGGFQGRPWGNNGHCTNMFVHGKEKAQTKQKTAQGKAGIRERVGLRWSAGEILESLGTISRICSIQKCILMALELRHFKNTQKKTWENADGEGAEGRKSWKPPLLFCCLFIVMIGHNVSLLWWQIPIYHKGTFLPLRHDLGWVGRFL